MGLLLPSKANKASQEALAKMIATERPLALVGAGLSVPAGLPSWSDLLQEMHRKLPSKTSSEYRMALSKEDDMLWRAQEYKDLFGGDTFESLLRNRFGRAPVVRPSNPAVALVKLPFRHLMTTNYDDVLLSAHKAAQLPPPNFLNWSREDDIRTFIFSLRNNSTVRFLLHLHGHHSDPKTIVLTDNDYTERYVRTNSTTRRLFAIFTTERVVFVGFSLNDPDLMALLREVNAVLRSNEPRHFAIMGLEHPISEAVERSRLRKRYGVEPVFYNNRDGKHRGLTEVLSYLSGAVAKTQAEPDSVLKQAQQRAETFEAKEFDPEDPQKGKWGGKSTANGREVKATVRELEPGWFEATIAVHSTRANKPLRGDVFFHLHPTIVPPVRSAPAVRGAARIKVESYGAYTVGVEADGGSTRLELDLAMLPNAPMLFRMN
jgi:SIR2-like domain/prokaryotic YEATS domain